LLTFLNSVVTMYHTVAIWKAWPGDIWARGLLVLVAALGAISLANVWVQAILGSGASLGSRTIECRWSVTPVPAEARGHGDV
jgi:hypothetical protein